MSDRSFDGAARIRQLPPRGMITLRGDLSNATVQNAAVAAAGLEFPNQGHANSIDDRGLAWMSRDEVLVMCPASGTPAVMAQMTKTLEAQHAMVTDVSDARALFRIEGTRAREVLAKLTPVDLRPSHFPPGRFIRTRLAQVACAFWATGENSFDLFAFRSVQDYVWDVLTTVGDTDATLDHFQ